MIVVVDANELFSLLIKGSKDARDILVSNKLHLIAPEFILVEFAHNKEEILLKTHRTEEDFIEFIPKACNLFPEHSKDVSYLALALKYNCPLWSEEKLLKKQARIKVLNTEELIKLVLI